VQNEKGFPGMLEQPVGFGRKSSVAGVGPGTTLLGKKSIVQVKVKLSQEVFPDAAAFLSKWHPVEPGPKNQLTGLGKRT